MLLLECSPDEMLARKLGFARRDLRHLAGKSRICKYLIRSKSDFGLIDEDPNSVQQAYFNDLKLSSEQHDMRVYYDGVRDNRIIVLRPRLEEWLIKTTELSGAAMTTFGLSNQGNELHREINSRISNLEKLLDYLLNKQDLRLMYLRTLLGL
jgi:predicted transcriptional regulator